MNLLFVGERDDLFYPANGAATVVKLDDYFVLNLTGHYNLNKHLKLFGRLENILDEDYEEVYGYGTPGFGAYAGIKYSF